MQPSSPRSGKLGRPALLSRDVIVRAAQRILDEEGYENLSMRRLARELSSTPMALYHYVRDKDQLLLLLLKVKASKFPRPPLPEDPRQRLIASAQLLYDILADCPFLAEILASDDLLAVSALWVIENIVDASIECGCAPEQAVDIYRVIWYYITGELLVRLASGRQRASLDRPTHREKAFAALRPDSHPRLFALSARWSELTSRDSHHQGLEVIVNGLLNHQAP
jgi:AcrR family transcriptional regulator